MGQGASWWFRMGQDGSGRLLVSPGQPWPALASPCHSWWIRAAQSGFRWVALSQFVLLLVFLDQASQGELGRILVGQGG